MKYVVEIDDEILLAAQRILGTATLKDTIEVAFREVVRAEARRDEIEALSRMEDMDFGDSDVMAGAWRS